jgi:hypothetical protein
MYNVGVVGTAGAIVGGWGELGGFKEGEGGAIDRRADTLNANPSPLLSSS